MVRRFLDHGGRGDGRRQVDCNRAERLPVDGHDCNYRVSKPLALRVVWTGHVPGGPRLPDWHAHGSKPVQFGGRDDMCSARGCGRELELPGEHGDRRMRSSIQPTSRSLSRQPRILPEQPPTPIPHQASDSFQVGWSYTGVACPDAGPGGTGGGGAGGQGGAGGTAAGGGEYLRHPPILGQNGAKMAWAAVRGLHASTTPHGVLRVRIL
jgi:hypothetical protein